MSSLFSTHGETENLWTERHWVYLRTRKQENKWLYASCLVTKSCPTLLAPHGVWLARLLCPWNFSGKNTGTGCHFLLQAATAAAAKSLQSCPTLCDPIDGSPPGSAVPGILQARILEWVAISFSNAWKWKVKVKLLNLPNSGTEPLQTHISCTASRFFTTAPQRRWYAYWPSIWKDSQHRPPTQLQEGRQPYLYSSEENRIGFSQECDLPRRKYLEY